MTNWSRLRSFVNEHDFYSAIELHPQGLLIVPARMDDLSVAQEFISMNGSDGVELLVKCKRYSHVSSSLFTDP